MDSISQVAEETAVKAPPPSHPAQQPTPTTVVPDFMRQWPARKIAPIPPKEAPNTRASRKEDHGPLTTSPLTPMTQQPTQPPPSTLPPPVKDVPVAAVEPKQELPSPSGGEIKVHTCSMQYVTCTLLHFGGL